MMTLISGFLLCLWLNCDIATFWKTLPYSIFLKKGEEKKILLSLFKNSVVLADVA